MEWPSLCRRVQSGGFESHAHGLFGFFVIVFCAVVLFGYTAYLCIFESNIKVGKMLQVTAEENRFKEYMRVLEVDDFEIRRQLGTFKSVSELVKANRRLEKAIKKHNLAPIA